MGLRSALPVDSAQRAKSLEACPLAVRLRAPLLPASKHRPNSCRQQHLPAPPPGPRLDCLLPGCSCPCRLPAETIPAPPKPLCCLDAPKAPAAASLPKSEHPSNPRPLPEVLAWSVDLPKGAAAGCWWPALGSRGLCCRCCGAGWAGRASRRLCEDGGGGRGEVSPKGEMLLCSSARRGAWPILQMCQRSNVGLILCQPDSAGFEVSRWHTGDKMGSQDRKCHQLLTCKLSQ